MRPDRVEDLIRAIQSGESKVEGDNKREYADAAFWVTWGFTGGNLKGTIGYAGTTVNFTSTLITEHESFFAGAGAMLHIAALQPELLKGKLGTAYTYLSGTWNDTLMLQIEVDGEQVLNPPMIVWGGGIGRKFQCFVAFS